MPSVARAAPGTAVTAASCSEWQADLVPDPTLYDVLGVTPEAGEDDLKAAYRRLSRQVHPDQGGSDLLFRAVHDAYVTLSDPARRAAYDARWRSTSDPVPEMTGNGHVAHGAGTAAPEVSSSGRRSSSSRRRRILVTAAGAILAIAGGSHGDDLLTLVGSLLALGGLATTMVGRRLRRRFVAKAPPAR